MTTAGSSPTTQASWPLGSEVTSPGPATNSVPSSIRIASWPLTWYWKCGAWQLSVFAIAFTSLDQRQPGSKMNRPTSPSPICTISARPFGNSRTSSGFAKPLCSVSCLACAAAISGSFPRGCDQVGEGVVETDHDPSAGACDASGLAQRAARVGGGLEGVPRRHDVERVVGVRKRVHVADGQVGLREALARKLDGLGRSVDAGDGGAPLGRETKEESRPAAD